MAPTEETISSQLGFLKQRLQLNKGIAYDPVWSASPDFLNIIVDHCLEHRPATIVECSSGVSSLMLAAACRINGMGQVISLENGREFAENSRAEIERHGLVSYAEILHAPLRKTIVNGDDFQWYGLDGLDGEMEIDMLVIDGPPGFLQEQSRYPALPLLFNRLAKGSTIFLDDAARPDERRIVQRWLSEYPGLVHDFIETERGCSQLHQ